MASYRLELSNHAERILARLAKREQALYQRVTRVLDALQHDPLLGKPLVGELKGHRSYRIGEYRIVYRIEHHRLVILVIAIGHRRAVYR